MAPKNETKRKTVEDETSSSSEDEADETVPPTTSTSQEKTSDGSSDGSSDGESSDDDSSGDDDDDDEEEEEPVFWVLEASRLFLASRRMSTCFFDGPDLLSTDAPPPVTLFRPDEKTLPNFPSAYRP
mmetsp:Transcript_26052/g.31544  ORF Transcript_26052/g.31544 Transcript_26052/m.31544 type:complete len:127 (+) Transcript_26052:45-425(+)